MNADSLEQLLSGLMEIGYDVPERTSDAALVRWRESGALFGLSCSGQWTQASQTILDADEIPDWRRKDLADLALRIQFRYLGCRFAFDPEDGSLAVLVDIYPGSSAEVAALALSQAAFVGAATQVLFRAATHEYVEEETIELALGDSSE
jgi:hypothetical protein